MSTPAQLLKARGWNVHRNGDHAEETGRPLWSATWHDPTPGSGFVTRTEFCGESALAVWRTLALACLGAPRAGR